MVTIGILGWNTIESKNLIIFLLIPFLFLIQHFLENFELSIKNIVCLLFFVSFALFILKTKLLSQNFDYACRFMIIMAFALIYIFL
jgi:hypothetical protein